MRHPLVQRLRTWHRGSPHHLMYRMDTQKIGDAFLVDLALRSQLFHLHTPRVVLRAPTRAPTHIDRRPRGSTHHHAASNLAMTTITKHSSSSAALRGNQRLRGLGPAQTHQTHPSWTLQEAPSSSAGGTHIMWRSINKHMELERGRGAGLWHSAVQRRSWQTRLRALPRAIDELYISHGVHRREARVGRVPSGAGRRPLPQLSALAAAPEPLLHAHPP
jgi:hypothetical protein